MSFPRGNYEFSRTQNTMSFIFQYDGVWHIFQQQDGVCKHFSARWNTFWQHCANCNPWWMYGQGLNRSVASTWYWFETVRVVLEVLARLWTAYLYETSLQCLQIAYIHVNDICMLSVNGVHIELEKTSGLQLLISVASVLLCSENSKDFL